MWHARSFKKQYMYLYHTFISYIMFLIMSSNYRNVLLLKLSQKISSKHGHSCFITERWQL
jgi:hypothetical protein